MACGVFAVLLLASFLPSFSPIATLTGHSSNLPTFTGAGMGSIAGATPNGIEDSPSSHLPAFSKASSAASPAREEPSTSFPIVNDPDGIVEVAPTLFSSELEASSFQSDIAQGTVPESRQPSP